MKKYAYRLLPMLLAIPMLAPAAWSQGKGREKHQAAASGYGSPNVVIVFTTQDRDIINNWFWDNRRGLPPGLANRESLPPGLQKQLQRNGTLPPGLQKKLTPMPYALDSRLVRLPSEIIRVVIGRDIVLMDRRNNIVLDIIPNVIRDRDADEDRRYEVRDRDREDDRDRDSDDDRDGRYRAANTASRDSNVYPPRTPAPLPASAPAPAPSKPAWHAGTVPASASRTAVQQPFNLKVRMTRTLSTEAAQTGERFIATLEQPIYEGTRMVARKGAQAEGQVVDSDKGGRVKGVASLSLKLLRIQTVTGAYADLSSDPIVVDANATKAKDATKIAVASGIGTAVGAVVGGGKGAGIGAATGAAAGTGVVLATRGDPAVIPSETVLEFAVRSY
jgi:hypothetical protein